MMKIKKIYFIILIVFAFLISGVESKAGTWSGVDETVVEKVAAEHGRRAWTPFINTDQGDLLLFVFLLAGTAGGFLLGYNFRKLFSSETKTKC